MDTPIIFIAKYVIFLIVLIAAVYALMQPRSRWLDIAKVGLPSLAVAFILLKIADRLYNDPRPFVVEHIQPLFAHGTDNGFPSDHATFGMTIAAIIFVFNRKLGIVLGILALLVGAARVLAHVHHSIDIIGGAVIGIVSVAIVYFALKKFNALSSNKPEVISGQPSES